MEEVERTETGRRQGRRRAAALGVALLMAGGFARAQETASGANAPVALTLKRAVEMALANSRDIRTAKLQASVA